MTTIKGNFVSEGQAYTRYRDPLLALPHPPVACTASLLNGLIAATATTTSTTTTTTKTIQHTEILGVCVVPLSMTCEPTILAEEPLQRSFKSHLAGDHVPEGL